MNENEKDQERIVHVLGTANNLASECYSVALEIKRLMGAMIDADTFIDSGMGSEAADLWAKIGGVEYLITVKKNRLL